MLEIAYLNYVRRNGTNYREYSYVRITKYLENTQLTQNHIKTLK